MSRVIRVNVYCLFWIKELDFVDRLNEFQEKMKKDIRRIKSTSNIFVKADKSDNIYEIPAKEYNKIILDNITTSYSLDEEYTVRKINADTYKATRTFRIHDTVTKLESKNCYILFKKRTL